MKKISKSLSDLKNVAKSLEEARIVLEDILSSADKARRENIIINVNYSCSLEEMIRAGNYPWKDDYIAEKNFPLSADFRGRKMKLSARLFHFNNIINSEMAIEEMSKASCRPASLAELLALGEIYPDLQEEFPIVALGSAWHVRSGGLRVPVLGIRNNERSVHLSWFNGGWNKHCRFLAIPE